MRLVIFASLALALTFPVEASAQVFKPWRSDQLLADPRTKLRIKTASKTHDLGSARQYFLRNEQGGPVVNVCSAARLAPNRLILRCDRKGGFHDRAKPYAWWWRYEAVIDAQNVTIISVAQKDDKFESGEAVFEHFHNEVDE